MRHKSPWGFSHTSAYQEKDYRNQNPSDRYAFNADKECPNYRPTRTNYSLQNAMRELTRPTMQLCIPTSRCSSTRSLSPGVTSLPALSPVHRERDYRECVPIFTVTPPAPPAQSLMQMHQRSSSTTATATPPPMGRPASKLERSNSLIGRSGGGVSLSLVPSFSPSQVGVIRRSWKHINTKGLHEVIRRCFQKLERTNPIASACFKNKCQIAAPAQQPQAHQPNSSEPIPDIDGDMSPSPTAGGDGSTSPSFSYQQRPSKQCRTVGEHTRYILALLDRIIESDQDVDLELKRVGAKHVILYEYFGFGVAEIEAAGEILAEAFFKLDGIRQSKETTKVWRILIAQIVDHIRDGFETELRFQRRRTSINPATLSSQPESRRNSMPSSRKNSLLRTEISNLARKLSDF